MCTSADVHPFIDAGSVPVQCTALHADRPSALAAPLGRMELVLCASCATVTNAAFDERLVAYDGAYENSQLFSPTFRSYAAGLADRLIRDHGLSGGHVVEVGSGKGEFLAMLAEAGAGSATGYDPTYGGEVDHLDPSLGVRLVRTMFDASTVQESPALICSRHVLEHVADPVAMLRSLRDAVAGDPSCLLYVEVPDAAYTFTPSGVWDIIYQHCSYFSDVSLGHVAAAAGFRVTDLRSVFEGQFLSLEARPSTPQRPVLPPDPARVATTVAGLLAFADSYRSIVDDWGERLGRWSSEGRRCVLWGGGAKGVTFLNLVGSGIEAVVDLNVRKQGRFLPGTAHEVLAPDALRAIAPDVVVVMNPAYEAEIRHDLAMLGLSPEIALA